MKAKLLVVDDEESLRALYQTFFEGRGYKVKTADSGEQALEIYKTYRPDILLLDVRMPGMGGFELARRIKALNTGQKIVYITGYTLDPPIREQLEQEPHPYISRPVGLQPMLEIVEKELRRT